MRLVEPRRGEAVIAPVVEHETRVHDTRPALERRHDLLRTGHLRHAGGVDEADCLDPRQPGGGQPVDELGADGRFEHDGVVLEPVARRDVADRDAAHTTPSCFSVSSSSVPSPSSPKISPLWLPSSQGADQRTAPGVSDSLGTIPGPM